MGNVPGGQVDVKVGGDPQTPPHIEAVVPAVAEVVVFHQEREVGCDFKCRSKETVHRGILVKIENIQPSVDIKIGNE